jgi:hypothetical protein
VIGPISDDRAGLGAGVGGVRDRGERRAAAQDVRAPILTSMALPDQQGTVASSGSSGWDVRGRKKEGVMLWTVAVILFVLWALGMGTAYTGGGLVHVLLVIAAIVVVYQFLAGRRTV